MFKVNRIAAFLIICSVAAGCKSTEKLGGNARSGLVSVEDVLAAASGNNFTAEGFIIRKGTIEMAGLPVEGDFDFNARMNASGDLLISVKGPLGIEVMRFIAVGEEVCLIDRLGRNVFLGRKNDLMRRYGIPGNYREIIFGDVPAGKKISGMSVEDGVVTAQYKYDNVYQKIFICREQSKVCRQIVGTDLKKEILEISYSEFSGVEKVIFPGEISIRDEKGMFHVKLTIDEIIPGYNEEIVMNYPAYRRKSL